MESNYPTVRSLLFSVLMITSRQICQTGETFRINEEEALEYQQRSHQQSTPVDELPRQLYGLSGHTHR